ncbi:MAG: hypothetical protein S4CHLAM102_03210 [Chlamydiia bacterium]|nr:hypothetical protein [Chlamydiia bacterium]
MREAIEVLNQITRPIVGLGVRPRSLYGCGLMLDFGQEMVEVQQTSRGERITKFGEWSFYLSFGNWSIEKYSRQLAYWGDDESRIEKTLEELYGKRFAQARILNEKFDLAIEFEVGYSVQIVSDLTFENDQWNFFDAEKKGFIAGPGKTWRYQSRDLP